MCYLTTKENEDKKNPQRKKYLNVNWLFHYK